MNHRASNQLRAFRGKNPFRDYKSSSFGDERISEEFLPTSKFWSLFNDQHEVLLGTRGSGKTVLLRMLSYNCFRLFSKRNNQTEAKDILEKRQYIGFYIPMHLEFAASLPKDTNEANAAQYFSFAFNSVACSALIDQLAWLVADCSKSQTQTLVNQSAVVDCLANWWLPDTTQQFRDLEELRDSILHIYETTDVAEVGTKPSTKQLAKPVLRPIFNVVRQLSDILGLDADKTRWLACIDEAEFLQPLHIRAINSFLRDEKRPLVVKMATLPFAHSTRETLYEGIEVEKDDFAYNWIDMDWDSTDFEFVTNHISRVRLGSIELGDQTPQDKDVWAKFIKTGTLTEFLGEEKKSYEKAMSILEEKRPNIDWYDEEEFLRRILAELSEERRVHFEETGDVDESRQSITKRFRPIFFLRMIREIQATGHNETGWYAGASVVLRIADGNPRTFIEIMNLLVEAARETDLTAIKQHQQLYGFSKRRNEIAQGLPKYGVTVTALIEKITEHLADRVHGSPMMDGGCHFRLAKEFLNDATTAEAIRVAIKYCHVRLSDVEAAQFNGLSEDNIFRLGFSHAVEHWLSFRKGDPPVIRAKDGNLGLFSHNVPTTAKEARDLIKQLRIRFDHEDE